MRVGVPPMARRALRHAALLARRIIRGRRTLSLGEDTLPSGRGAAGVAVSPVVTAAHGFVLLCAHLWTGLASGRGVGCAAVLSGAVGAVLTCLARVARESPAHL